MDEASSFEKLEFSQRRFKFISRLVSVAFVTDIVAL
jgi:hypothetical protein